MINRYIFDLDNTLIYTNILNNNSYNYALQQQGLEPILDYERITRDIVFIKYPHLNNELKNKIIELKQEFFVNNIQDTRPNKTLFKTLKSHNNDYCVLWTSADEARVQALLEYYIISDDFKKILFSKKSNVLQDVERICELFGCKSEQLVFYEDNWETIKKLQEFNLKIISV